MLRLFTALSALDAVAGFVMSPALGIGRPNALAEAEAELIIPEESGYGINRCLDGSECRMAVAYAWCEAHGFSQVAIVRPEDTGRRLSVSCLK